MSEERYLGIDFGAGRVRVGAVAQDGRLLSTAEVGTEAGAGTQAALASLDRAVRDAAERAGMRAEEASAIGVAAPGQVDAASGAVIYAPNLGWVDVPLGELLRERYGKPVAVENDANAAAYGEALFGAGKDHAGVKDLVLLAVGTGIGGGIVSNGELVGGSTGAAGEAGHMVFRPEGKVCSCGARGHFEAYAGSACVETKFHRLLREGVQSLAQEIAGGDAERVTIDHIFEAAERGCDTATNVVEEIRLAIGTLAANVTTLLNPALLVVGGSVVKRRRALVQDCGAAVARAAMRASARACRVVESRLWEDAALLGAAELARRRARVAA